MVRDRYRRRCDDRGAMGIDATGRAYANPEGAVMIPPAAVGVAVLAQRRLTEPSAGLRRL